MCIGGSQPTFCPPNPALRSLTKKNLVELTRKHQIFNFECAMRLSDNNVRIDSDPVPKRQSVVDLFLVAVQQTAVGFISGGLLQGAMEAVPADSKVAPDRPDETLTAILALQPTLEQLETGGLAERAVYYQLALLAPESMLSGGHSLLPPSRVLAECLARSSPDELSRLNGPEARDLAVQRLEEYIRLKSNNPSYVFRKSEAASSTVSKPLELASQTTLVKPSVLPITQEVPEPKAPAAPENMEQDGVDAEYEISMDDEAATAKEPATEPAASQFDGLKEAPIAQEVPEPNAPAAPENMEQDGDDAEYEISIGDEAATAKEPATEPAAFQFDGLKEALEVAYTKGTDGAEQDVEKEAKQALRDHVSVSSFWFANDANRSTRPWIESHYKQFEVQEEEDAFESGWQRQTVNKSRFGFRNRADLLSSYQEAMSSMQEWMKDRTNYQNKISMVNHLRNPALACLMMSHFPSVPGFFQLNKEDGRYRVNMSMLPPRVYRTLWLPGFGYCPVPEAVYKYVEHVVRYKKKWREYKKHHAQSWVDTRYIEPSNDVVEGTVAGSLWLMLTSNQDAHTAIQQDLEYGFPTTALKFENSTKLDDFISKEKVVDYYKDADDDDFATNFAESGISGNKHRKLTPANQPRALTTPTVACMFIMEVVEHIYVQQKKGNMQDVREWYYEAFLDKEKKRGGSKTAVDKDEEARFQHHQILQRKANNPDYEEDEEDEDEEGDYED